MDGFGPSGFRRLIRTLPCVPQGATRARLEGGAAWNIHTVKFPIIGLGTSIEKDLFLDPRI